MGLFKAIFNPKTLMGGAMIGAGAISGQPWLIGAGIGTTAGGISGSLEKQAAEKRRNTAIDIEAIKAKYAPFTGETSDIAGAAATPIPSVFSRALSGGITGGFLGHQIGKANAQKELLKKMSGKAATAPTITGPWGPQARTFNPVKKNLLWEGLTRGGLTTGAEQGAGAPIFQTEGLASFYRGLQ